MRVIAYLVALIYAHQAIAGLPPTKLGGQSGTAFANFNFFTPANQSTKVTGGGLIETGNRNLLINGEFEAAILAGPAILGWTSTGTAAPDLETSGALFGKQSLRFDPSAQTINIYQDYTPAGPILVGTNAQIKFSARSNVAGGTACVRHTGVALTGDSNCVNIASDEVKRDYVIPTKFGSGSTGVEFNFPSGTGIVLIDSVELGDRLDVSDVQQARLLGTLTYAATTNCAWSTTSTTAVAFAADPDCPTPTVTGEISAPGTKIPAFVIPAGITGSIQVVARGAFLAIDNGSSAQDAIFSFNDGSSTTNIGRLRYADGDAVGSDITIPNLSFGFQKSSGSQQTIQIYGQVTGPSQTATISAFTVPLQFDVYYYPPANKIFSTDSLGWFIDANIGGANPDLGVANVATYTEITNAGLDLVVNTAKGSQSAKILCSGTQAPSGLTCAGAGVESVGISFVIPKSGQYEVCADFAHNVNTGATAGSAVDTIFQLVETPVNAQTISQEGGSRISSRLTSVNASTNQIISNPNRNCGIFNFSSVGEKAVRLFYEQGTGGSPVASLVLADRAGGAGQRDIHFTVKPAINLERINGSFAQIEDSLKTIPNHNYVINGNFDFWQRGTSLGAGTGGRYLADRFRADSVGTTNSVSRQAFALGQTDVPNNPEFFHREVIASVAGASNFAILNHRVEDVTKLSGKTVTLSFWAKADASRSMAIEFVQSFGTGGSPSANVNGIGVKSFALTTSWQRFTQTVTLPSVTGKTLGTNNNDNLDLHFWFDCGSSFASRCGSIGQQSGTFDIAQVKLEEGINATPFVLAGGTIAGELANCERFYVRRQVAVTATNYTANIGVGTIIYPGSLRSQPAPTIESIADVINFAGTNTVTGTPFSGLNNASFSFSNGRPSGNLGTVAVTFNVDAEL